MKRLETERLWLRPLQKEDLQDFNEYSKTANVGPNAGWKPHESMEESEKILDSMINGEDEVRALVYKKNNKMIGTVGIHNDKSRPDVPNCKMLGYVLAEPYWGKGLMTEAVMAVIPYAFEELKLNIFTVWHYTFNQKSARVIEKCGFRYEGTLRQSSVIFDGSVFDSCAYSMTKREYLLSKAKKSCRLVLPEDLTKEAYLDYIREWTDCGEKMVPYAAGLRDMSYDQWLQSCISDRTTAPEGFVPGTTYFLVDMDGKIHGSSNIRHELNDSLLQIGGHIGYGVRPSSRRQGYAGMILALSLEETKNLGINRALVTCDADNTGSAKTIESCGGIFENTVVCDGTEVRRYWITV